MLMRVALELLDTRNPLGLPIGLTALPECFGPRELSFVLLGDQSVRAGSPDDFVLLPTDDRRLVFVGDPSAIASKPFGDAGNSSTCSEGGG